MFLFYFIFFVGIVMEMMTVVMEQMSHQSTVRVTEELVLVIYSHVIMETVYQEFIYVTVIMTVWITVMKTVVINVVSMLASFVFLLPLQNFLEHNFIPSVIFRHLSRRIPQHSNCL